MYHTWLTNLQMTTASTLNTVAVALLNKVRTCEDLREQNQFSLESCLE